MRSWLFGGRGGATVMVDLALAVLRVFAGASLALAHGLGKMPPSQGFVGAVANLGFPAPFAFAWAAALAELVGGLLLAIGLLTRPAAFFVAFTMAVAGFGQHAADPFARKELAFVYLAVAFLFVCAGSGRFGFDRLIRGR